MMRNYDIKFVNKEITPFGGLSLFLKMLEKCHFDEHLASCSLPQQGSNRGYKPIQIILGLFAGVVPTALVILMWYVMMQRFVSFLAGNVVLTIVHINVISTSFPKQSINAYSVSCSSGFSLS